MSHLTNVLLTRIIEFPSLTYTQSSAPYDQHLLDIHQLLFPADNSTGYVSLGAGGFLTSYCLSCGNSECSPW